MAVLPLLGLLGTVTGMITVFDVMAFAGTGNAQADGRGRIQGDDSDHGGPGGRLVGPVLRRLVREKRARMEIDRVEGLLVAALTRIEPA
jgi:biopolymer transport protein ExbB